MSALGQKRTLRLVRLMSALPPKADIAERDRNVPFVPKADIVQFDFRPAAPTLPRALPLAGSTVCGSLPIKARHIVA